MIPSKSYLPSGFCPRSSDDSFGDNHSDQCFTKFRFRLPHFRPRLCSGKARLSLVAQAGIRSLLISASWFFFAAWLITQILWYGRRFWNAVKQALRNISQNIGDFLGSDSTLWYHIIVDTNDCDYSTWWITWSIKEIYHIWYHMSGVWYETKISHRVVCYNESYQCRGHWNGSPTCLLNLSSVRCWWATKWTKCRRQCQVTKSDQPFRVHLVELCSKLFRIMFNSFFWSLMLWFTLHYSSDF